MDNLYKEIIVDGICLDIKKAQNNNALAGAIILTYAAIDAMAFLSMPSSQDRVIRGDFLDWVSRYMKTAEGQAYQYDGIDLYGARCGILHNYGAESRLSRDGECKFFSYHDGTEHLFDPNKNERFVLLSSRRFINDFMEAVRRFLEAVSVDTELKSRVDGRIRGLFRVSRAS